MKFKKNVTVKFGEGYDALSLTGTLRFQEFQLPTKDKSLLQIANLLELDTEDDEMPERLSLQMTHFGINDIPGHVWIKDWTEHSGVTQSLVDAGVGEVNHSHVVNQQGSKAFRLKLNLDDWDDA